MYCTRCYITCVICTVRQFFGASKICRSIDGVATYVLVIKGNIRSAAARSYIYRCYVRAGGRKLLLRSTTSRSVVAVTIVGFVRGAGIGATLPCNVHLIIDVYGDVWEDGMTSRVGNIFLRLDGAIRFDASVMDVVMVR